MSTRFRAAFSLYVSDICSHSSGVTTAGSTRVSGGRITRKPPSSDGASKSGDGGRQSGIFGPVVNNVGAGSIGSGGGVTTPTGNHNHHHHHHGHPHPLIHVPSSNMMTGTNITLTKTPSPVGVGILNGSKSPDIQWTRNHNKYYHV